MRKMLPRVARRVAAAQTVAALFLVLIVKTVKSEILTPPYFNLAEGRKITASATCGEETEGPELYCKLVGANAENDLNVNVIQGQYCDYCDPSRPDKRHPPEYAVDGLETWWQSPPLSRGMKYNEVNLTIDLGQEFHVAYVYIRMGNSPRPGLWILEKSADYGITYKPWQYFSDSKEDCESHFGPESLQPITRDDSIRCVTEYSKIVPLEGGEIPIPLLNNRPSANHYFNSSVLQEWTRATNVRFRFLRTKNLLGHLMSVARQDPTVTRRYFYSIKDISIGGRCMCNGHADTCDIQDPSNPNILLCRCQHNTCGAKCQTCCRGYQQKAWRISKSYKPFICEPCNCFEHSRECIYDAEVDEKQLSLDIRGNYEGGGVCQNCQDNTEGINCNRCKATYYRPYGKHWNETDVCQSCECNFFYSTGNCEEGTGKCECRKEFTPPNCNNCSFGYYDYPNCKSCECYLNGTQSLQCEPNNGQCTCLPNYGGHFCKECAPQYYNFPECKHCECNTLGSSNTTCNQTNGQCTCKNNYGGKQCDRCQNGYYQFPSCSLCQCSVKGTQPEICNKDTGSCLCKEGYGGPKCDECLPGFFGYPDCQSCNCSKQGSASSICDASGVCPCLSNFGGRTCEKCSVGYYKYPECLPCGCDGHGSIGVSCDDEGLCRCLRNFDGNQCNKCREGFYNFPICEECNCNPAGVVAAFAGCGSVPLGELCQCKDRVQGRICDQCKPLFWNLHLNNPEGCEACQCHIPGVLGGNAVCNTETGQCVCKPAVVARGCSECADGTYNLQADSLFGCTDCGCDVGGSISPICDKISGQCSCQSRVSGRTCKEPLKAHYFPTLYQYQYEVEDGHSPTHTAVRYAYDDGVFQGYSWKGYAVFSALQNEILQDVYIYKPSLYQMVIRYINSNPDAVTGIIKIIPENPIDNEQVFKVSFKPSTVPAYVSVLGASGTALVLNPGHWTVSIQTKQSLLVDYFVLLPEDFYLATILNQKVEEPCVVGANKLCREYSYPNSSNFDMSWGSGGFNLIGGVSNSLMHYYDVTDHLSQVGITSRLPILNNVQSEITYNVTIRKQGRYVIVVNYLTPLNDKKSHAINVETVAQNGRRGGKIILYSCPYTTVCRQAVTDKQNGIGVHLVDGNFITVSLQGLDASAVIHSVVAVPLEEWSLDYIKPKSVCIRKDGLCISSTFPNPPESKKIQFEQEFEGNSSRIYRTSNSTAYVYLNPTEDMIDLRAKVVSPGSYVFVVQYFQPDFPEFELNAILQNGEFYEAIVPVSHCPSSSGCRALIHELNGNIQFSLTENVLLTLKQPNNKRVFLDYLLIIPADLYTPRILEEDTLDRTGEFLSTCGSNNFNIDTTLEGFCRDSVFSITAAHNNGALPCQCDFDGSLSFECDKFGGQCPCKSNIIGRQCGACKTGYYGFPDCKPCNCPSIALCETSTGRCICPPHVTGDLCDQCIPYTYGYDPIIGCEECKCHPLGVARDLQCNLLNGSCTCKDNIVGRACDTCQAGFFAFPYCERCECDLRGTVEEICDQVSAECLCKKHVTGPTCGICREGSYNLQKNNKEGCTECFCFGKTTRCVSSNYIQVAVLIMEDWKVVTINETETRLSVAPLNVTVVPVDPHATIGVDFTTEDIRNKSVYFAAPRAYLGRKLTAYGGFLNFTIFYTIGMSGKAVSGADVILEGAGSYILYTSDEQPASSVNYFSALHLVESNFHQPNGLPAKREHIMAILQDLRGVYIRAVFWSASITTRISNVLMDDSVPHQYYNSNSRDLKYASSVEHCQCPPGYNGLSCEDCAPGFYRISTGPHGGYCVPCQCNGHADECDVYTGACLNCKHNTRGEHCELCGVGYHGNALQGTPMDCLICACPLPIPSNNFASACDVSSDGEKISCECDEGYFGARCQSCAPGYYGRPEVVDDFCKPCQCSGNIRPEEPGSCDTVSGECLRCLNNTFGETCALCSPGFYGDAIRAKNCQPCICDQMGTHRCNSYTGLCECKPNVVGEKCDRCEIEHYGFQSGYGCTPCNCSYASVSSQCDDATGQCRCKPGVGGRSCDRCSAGFWNYSPNGCESCGCKTEYSVGFGCNAHTGHCECLQGVVGEKCDQCPPRWVFVPEVGCHICDKCTDDLLNVSDDLHRLIDPYLNEFDSVDSGYFTTQRLSHINQTLNGLRPKVASLDPNTVNLTSLVQRVESFEQHSKNLNKNAIYFANNSDGLLSESDAVRDDALTVLEAIREAAQQAMDAISNVDFLSESLMAGEGPKIDSAVLEAQKILNDIKVHNLTGKDNDASKQLGKAAALLGTLREFKQPVEDSDMQFKKAKIELKMFNEKIDDLYNHTQYSLGKAVDAENIYNKTGKDAVIKKLQNVEIQTEEIAVHLVDSEKLLKNASDYLTASRKALNSITDEPKTLQTTNSRLNTTLEEHYNGITAIEEILPEVQEHASNLSSHAQELDNLLSETRNISNNAIRAATAYKNIVEAVDDAQHAANTGKSAANNATSVLSEVSDDTITSSSLSADLLLSAHAANEESVTNLRPRLLEAEAKSRPVRSVHNANEDKLSEIERYLKAPHAKTYSSDLVNATNLATDSDTLAQNTLNNVETSFKEVSEEKKASQYLPNKIQDVRKNIQQTEKHLLAINEKFPEIERIIATLPEQQERVRLAAENINEKIKMLNQQIALARDVANRIKVGLKFYPNTTLELRNPPNVQDLSTSTYISGYFRTKDLNGLLLYLGNGHGTNLRRTTSDDYMALEVENGYLVLTADVGNGPQRVLNPKRVSDNNWYQFIIDRTAHNAKLTVREQIEDGQEQLHTASEDLQGHYTIFNLDKNKSKLFVGGYPSQFPVQEQVRQHSFNGEIEDLVIGEIPISLWNFNEGKENNHGAVRRDKLVNLQPSTGYRFNGNGYAIIDARSFLLRSRSDIKLSFKTFAPNGLLFLVHGSSNKTFISLEVRDGHVIYQYNLGYETKLYYTPKLYNDGNWHTIEASRAGSKGRLMVDGAEIADNGVAITGNVLETFETFIFGGYPKFHGLTEVSNVDFDGCIDNVTIGSPIDLSQNIKAYGVIPACPEKFARLVSFSEEKAGYIRNGDFSSNDLFQMNLKFKTKSKDGLIMFATDNFKTEGVSLGIVGGRLVLIAQKIKLETDDNNYNDNEWHVVTITHNITTLRLDIDDYATKVTDSPPPPIRVMYGEIFFGGLPANYDISKGMIPTRKSFSGCVIDASKNGAIINFASYKDKDGDILGRCVLDEEIGSDYHEVPTLPTIPEIAFITTKAPVFVTEDPVLANVPKRGDGAWQNSAGKRVTTYGPPETTEEVTEYVPHIFTSKPVEEIAPSPFPLPVTTPPEKMPQATRGPTVGPSCVLPMVPELDVTAPTTSYKYGGEPYSRSEYSVARGKFRSQFYFNLEFKTSATEGIIFYIESPPESQYVAVFLQNGHVIYTFSDGYGSAIMRSDQPYSDGAWHSVNASRNGASGKLIIDDETVADISPSNEIITSPLDLPHYIGVGGVPPTKITEVFKYINTTATFDGCIKNFRMNDFVMEDPNNFGVTPCSENIEPGAFFGIREGYIKLKEKHRVGLEIDVKLEIKPRNISGVLIAVHGRRDYLVLEMINGVIKLTVDNGKGAISTLFKPDKVHYFCDGQWHNIQAVKSKNVVTLSVDSTFTDPGVGDYRSQSTDTGGALFLGGHRYLSSARGIITRTSFVGCIRNVQVNNVPIKLTQKMAAGHVAVGSCPTV